MKNILDFLFSEVPSIKETKSIVSTMDVSEPEMWTLPNPKSPWTFIKRFSKGKKASEIKSTEEKSSKDGYNNGTNEKLLHIRIKSVYQLEVEKLSL